MVEMINPYKSKNVNDKERRKQTPKVMTNTWKKLTEDLLNKRKVDILREDYIIVGMKSKKGRSRLFTRPRNRHLGMYQMAYEDFLKTGNDSMLYGLLQERNKKIKERHNLYRENNKEKIKERNKKYQGLYNNREERNKMIRYITLYKGRCLHVFKTYIFPRRMSDEEVKGAYLKMKAYNKIHRGEKID